MWVAPFGSILLGGVALFGMLAEVVRDRTVPYGRWLVFPRGMT